MMQYMTSHMLVETSRLPMAGAPSRLFMTIAAAAVTALIPALTAAQGQDVAAPTVEIQTEDGGDPTGFPGLDGGTEPETTDAPSGVDGSRPGSENPYAPLAQSPSPAEALSNDGAIDPYVPARPGSEAPIIAAPAASQSNFLPSDGGTMPVQSGALVVVELFTSQGCSTCPPADNMLAELADRPGVLALSYHVDYWDYLGWADRFARPEFTSRQKGYARAAGERAIFTPQIVVGGEHTALSLGPVELTSLIDTDRLGPALVTVAKHHKGATTEFDLTPQSDVNGQLAVLMVRYLPVRSATVESGENSGRHLTYRNVVLSVEKLAEWNGRGPMRMKVSEGAHQAGLPADTRNAILVQRMDSRGTIAGPILTAIRLD